jgi:hypothetical protein
MIDRTDVITNHDEESPFLPGYMKSTLDLRKRFWFFGFNCEYQLEQELQDGQIPDLADRLLGMIAQDYLKPGSVIQDVKGRDPLNMIDTTTAAELWPKGDEMLFLTGQVFHSGDEDGGESSLKGPEMIERQPFQVRVQSKFKEFPGANHIAFDLLEQRAGDLPEFVKVQHLGHVFPLEIDYFRIGLDLYQSQFISNMMGASPTVNRTLLVECSRKRLLIKISDESLKQRDDLPLQKDDLFSRLGVILKDLFAFDLADDYRQKSGPK